MGPVALFVVSHFRSPRRNRGVGDFQLGYNFHRSGAYFCQPELGQDDKTFICMMDYIGAKLVSCRLRSIGERMLLQTLENFGSQSFSPVVKALSVGLMTRWCLTTSAKMRRPTSSPRGRPRPTAPSCLLFLDVVRLLAMAAGSVAVRSRLHRHRRCRFPPSATNIEDH